MDENKKKKSDWILWLILSLLVLGIILIFSIVRLPPKSVTIGEDVPSCSKLLEFLPDVSSEQFIPCLTLLGDPDSQRYYDRLNNWTVLPLDPVIAPSAQQICVQYCPQVQLGSNNPCITENEEYLKCLELLSPVQCSDPAVPVARKGSQEYYAIGRGKVSCY